MMVKLTTLAFSAHNLSIFTVPSKNPRRSKSSGALHYGVSDSLGHYGTLILLTKQSSVNGNKAR